jgi:hypothetical protein
MKPRFHTLFTLVLAGVAHGSPLVQLRALIAEQPVVSQTKPNTTSSSNSTTLGAAATNASVVLPDGRIQQNVVAADFNVLASVFKSAVVKGDGKIIS